MICIECNYEGDDFKPRGYTKNGKADYACPICGRRSVNHLQEAEDNLCNMEKRIRKAQDKSLRDRRVARSIIREQNVMEEYLVKLTQALDRYKLTDYVVTHKPTKNKNIGLIQVSDAHFNELVDIVSNKYDFTEASKRLQKFSNECKTYLKAHNVNNVLLAMTGDMLNSDRRDDEKLSMATNRSVATVIAQDLMCKFILDLNKSFNISVASVVGNEGRVKQELAFSDIAATDNYDFMIYQMIKYRFKDSKINFIDGPANEIVVPVGNKNVLMLHGFNIKQDVEKEVQKLKGQWASKGIQIDYVIFGHQHSARLGDTYGRSSSLVGPNAYSESWLMLDGRASQNCYLFTDTGDIHGLVVDLQNTHGYKGYPLYLVGDCYNPKSVEKLNKALKGRKVSF